MTRLVIVTHGDKANGLGHVSREMVLARELISRGIEVCFRTDADTLGANWLVRAGFSVLFGSSLPAADGLIVDFENGPSRATLRGYARNQARKLIVVAGNGYTLQDYPAVVEYADLEIYQGLDNIRGDPQRRGRAFSGIEYIIVDSAYAACKPRADGPVVVVMGGTDPHDLTPRVLEALAGLDVEVKVPRGEPSLVPYMDGAALLVGAFGTVAWEALAAGVPCLLTGWSTDHMRVVDILSQRYGVADSLGIWKEFDSVALRRLVKRAQFDTHLWHQMSDRAKALVDGQGAARVAERICQLITVQ